MTLPFETNFCFLHLEARHQAPGKAGRAVVQTPAVCFHAPRAARSAGNH